MAKKTIQMMIRNEDNTGWDEILPIGVDLSVEAPKSGYTVSMTMQAGLLVSDLMTQVTILTEVYKDEHGVAIKTVKTKIVYAEADFPNEFVEMINVPGGESYEVFTVISFNENGFPLANEVIQPYGTWDANNPVDILY